MQTKTEPQLSPPQSPKVVASRRTVASSDFSFERILVEPQIDESIKVIKFIQDGD